MKKKEKIKCNLCGTINYVFIDEMSFKTKNKFMHMGILCTSCCKKINWLSKKCKNCSDKIICSGKFKRKFKKWLDKKGGI